MPAASLAHARLRPLPVCSRAQTSGQQGRHPAQARSLGSGGRVGTSRIRKLRLGSARPPLQLFKLAKAAQQGHNRCLGWQSGACGRPFPLPDCSPCNPTLAAQSSVRVGTSAEEGLPLTQVRASSQCSCYPPRCPTNRGSSRNMMAEGTWGAR